MVTHGDRVRAGLAVAARMAERGLDQSSLARRAKLDRKTVGALLSGQRWPRMPTRARIERALGWPLGTIERRAGDREPVISSLAEFSDLDLLNELCRRASQREKAATGNGPGR